MYYRQLTPKLPDSSALAFGCASIMGRIGKKQSTRALQQAIDAGITHFDIAPSYGYGEAESCLGQALKPYRDKILIATKFGILPAKSSRAFNKLKPLLQATMKLIPVCRPLLKKGISMANVTAIPKQFSLNIAKKNVEESLLRLNTDYIDLLFLHECTASDLTEELIAFLHSLMKEGKIRAYGAATSIDAIASIEKQQRLEMVLQFPNGLMNSNHEQLASTESTFSTHGAFSGIDALISLIKHCRIDLASIGLGTLQQDDVYELMLSYALLVNPKGTVISSMLTKQHLQKNLRVVEYPRFSPEQVTIFSETVKHAMNRHIGTST